MTEQTRSRPRSFSSRTNEHEHHESEPVVQHEEQSAQTALAVTSTHQRPRRILSWRDEQESTGGEPDADQRSPWTSFPDELTTAEPAPAPQKRSFKEKLDDFLGPGPEDSVHLERALSRRHRITVTDGVRLGFGFAAGTFLFWVVLSVLLVLLLMFLGGSIGDLLGWLLGGSGEPMAPGELPVDPQADPQANPTVPQVPFEPTMPVEPSSI